MQKFVSRLFRSEIVRVFSLTSVSTLIRMLTGLISTKVVSVIIGPSGIALMGQLNGFIQIVSSFAQGGINNGVTRYVAENTEKESALKSLLSSAFRFTLICTAICGIFSITASKLLSHYLLMSEEYGYLFVIFGLTLIFYTINGLILSIINGFQQYNKYIWINILNSIFGATYIVILVLLFGLKGAFIGAVTFQSFMFFITICMVRELFWIKPDFWRQRIDKPILRKLLHYSAMTLVSMALLPMIQLFLRSYVITEISAVEAGWWEALNRLSNMYLMVITSSFGVYYLPKLAGTKSNQELRYEIIKAAKFILPLLTAGLTIIYFLRFFIIRILFSAEFLPMENLFIWQLIGDLFKIGSWLIAFVMVAKAHTKRYITIETIFGILYLVFSFLFLQLYGTVSGILKAYLINYIIYAVALIILYRKLLFRPQSTIIHDQTES